MAKLEIIHPAKENFPAFTETIEVRVWGLGGDSEQAFYIGSGLNFHADSNLWLEIIYSVEGAQIFYTRNFLHHDQGDYNTRSALESKLNQLAKEGEGVFSFGDMLPETRLQLILINSSTPTAITEDQQYGDCKLKISSDTGAVFGRSGPGESSVDIQIDFVEQADGVRFMRELILEIEAAQYGKRPDPASFPDGSCEWPFVWQLNQTAYDKISAGYQEGYFDHPVLSEAFDGWLACLPRGGKILDAGCGHGLPVIGRLLDQGFQVTGSDFSPKMLARARQQFPRGAFIQQATTMIRDQAVFDGICSFNSILYLDPIDLLNSIYRLHNALKPEGLLFLYGYDSGPDWRGEPFGHKVGQWMWSWHYGMQEAASTLEEHGYFKVLETRKVKVDEGEAQRIAEELEKRRQEEKEYRQKLASDSKAFHMPFGEIPIEHSAYSFLVIAQRCEK